VNGYAGSVEIRRATPIDAGRFAPAVQVFAFRNYTLLTNAQETLIDNLIQQGNTSMGQYYQRIVAADQVRAAAVQP